MIWTYYSLIITDMYLQDVLCCVHCLTEEEVRIPSSVYCVVRKGKSCLALLYRVKKKKIQSIVML